MSGPDPRRAPEDVINGVLTKLVREVLTLRPEHRSKLIARGLSPAEIARQRYVSVPSISAERRRAADALAPFLDLFGGGVPGFYWDGGRWRMVYRPAGYFVAVRDEHGRVQALSQRVDEPRDGGKYIWFSSADRDGGASSGAPPHFAGRHLLREAEEVTITEGSLKAEVSSFLSGAPVVGVAGTHATAGLTCRLKTNFTKLCRAVIAYDRDFVSKPEVYSALMRLSAQLESAGFRVTMRVWPPPAKGYDDFLLSQLQSQGVRAA